MANKLGWGLTGLILGGALGLGGKIAWDKWKKDDDDASNNTTHSNTNDDSDDD